MQAKAERDAHLSQSELDSKSTEAAEGAASHRQQLQRLQHDLQLTQHNAQETEQQSVAHARRQQNQTEALTQQLDALQQQLAQATREAELHNQKRLQAEETVAALQLHNSTVSAAPCDDSILLQNLRDELAAQSADVAEARRLKGHVK